jgi:hypothetical protein
VSTGIARRGGDDERLTMATFATFEFDIYGNSGWNYEHKGFCPISIFIERMSSDISLNLVKVCIIRYGTRITQVDIRTSFDHPVSELVELFLSQNYLVLQIIFRFAFSGYFPYNQRSSIIRG